MVEAVLSIGSNCDRERHITAALDALSKQFGALSISPVYESIATDGSGTYYNLVVIFRTQLDLVSLKQTLRAIESQQDRQRTTDEVTIDLDLLLYDNLSDVIDGIQLPHKAIINCAYVLRPISDLLPDQIHPSTNKSYKRMWQEFSTQYTLTPVDFVWRDKVISTSVTCCCL